MTGRKDVWSWIYGHSPAGRYIRAVEEGTRRQQARALNQAHTAAIVDGPLRRLIAENDISRKLENLLTGR